MALEKCAWRTLGVTLAEAALPSDTADKTELFRFSEAALQS